MSSRLLPLALVASAALADGRERHQLAFYLLVAAVPAAAIAALSAFGELVELPGREAGELAARVEATLAVLGLLAVLLAAGVRGQSPEVSAVPTLGVSALVLCLVVFAAHSLTLLAAPPRGAPAAES